VYNMFPGRMPRLEVSLIMRPVPKNIHYGGGGVDRHFQAKLADCGWILQVDRFLPIAGEICFLREALLEAQ